MRKEPPSRRSRRLRAALLAATLATAGTLAVAAAREDDDAPLAGTAGEDLPPGFQPMELPGLADVKRQRMEKIEAEVDISFALRRREVFHTQERLGQVNRRLWETW